MTRRLVVAVTVWAIGVTCLFAPITEAQSADVTSIVFLFDLSFSMSLETNGRSRLSSAQSAARFIVDSTEGQARWAVLAFEDRNGVLGTPSPTQDAPRVRKTIAGLTPWGRSPLGAALAAAMDMAEEPSRIVLLSDLLDSDPIGDRSTTWTAATHAEAGGGGGGHLGELVSTAKRLGHTIDVLYTALPSPAQAIPWANALTQASGGSVYRVHEVADLVGRLVSEPKTVSRVVEETEIGTAGIGSSTRDADRAALSAHEGVPVRRESAESLDRTDHGLGARGLSWVLIVLAGAGAALAVVKYKRWHREVDRAMRTPPKPLFSVRITDTRRNENTYVLRRFPVIIGNGGNSTIQLHSPFPGKSGRSPDVRIERESARAVFSSNTLLNVNGAGKRHKVLNDGDMIRYGRYTITFEGLTWEKPTPPESRTYLRYAALPVAALTLALVFRTEALAAATNLQDVPPIGVEAERPGTRLAAPSSILESSVDSGSRYELTRTTDSAAATEEPSAIGERRDRPPADSSAARPRDGNSPEPTTVGTTPEVVESRPPWSSQASVSSSLPEMYLYPDLPRGRSVDVLIVHAHPDDETLDTGCLAAAASMAGLSVGVVLFTDGISGLDQYPWRPTTAGYPSRRLSGRELAGLRVSEAARAMMRLGVDVYVRLGLPNHPYSRLEDELKVEDVIERWGGYAAIRSGAEQIVRALDPLVVVSPDGPSDALEHFEHETVGVIAAEAVAELGNSVMAHLVSVDPLQTDAYNDEVGFHAWDSLSDSGPRFRDVQLSALREHRTQRDASVIGIEVRQGLSKEYYRILDWRFRSPHPRSFGGLVTTVGKAAKLGRAKLQR